MYYGFVYKWTNKENGKFYIGSHYGKVDDGYIGSGVWFRRSYDLDPTKFERQILLSVIINCRQTILELEELILNETEGVGDKTKAYNISKTTGGGWQLYGKSKKEIKEVYSKISKTLLEKPTEEKEKIAHKIRATLKINEKERVAKHKKTTSSRNLERKAEISANVQASRINPETELKRKTAWLETVENRTEERKKEISEKVSIGGKKRFSKQEERDKISQSRKNMTEEQKEIAKQKTKATLEAKSSEEIETSKNKFRQSFANRPLEEKELSEKKRMETRMKNIEKTSKNISKALQKLPLLVCPYCGDTGRKSKMTRWHFENCKRKI